MKIVTGLLTESAKSYAANAGNGKVRVSLAETAAGKTDWWDGVRNV